MALLPIYNYFVFNGKLAPVAEFVPSENEGGIYEVLRVVNGVPLFLEDHLKRFYHSAEIAGKSILFSNSEIQSFLKQLIKHNLVQDGNILISCKTNLKAFFIAHKYPTTIQYEQGVSCGVLHAERVNPNAKVFQTTVRQKADKLIAENSLYEVLLVDQEKFVTEGSRTNVFFVKDNSIVTPEANKVLLGITRQKTIQCAAELGLSIIEKEVSIENLAEFEAIFLTGTSPKLLPVKSIGRLEFNTDNLVLRKLIEQYNFKIQQYIKNAQL